MYINSHKPSTKNKMNKTVKKLLITNTTPSHNMQKGGICYKY